jgi:hypothetical protein
VTPKNNLAKDTRGAVLILGVVMGALLVGALWHVAAVGDAIFWRERAQDAADAAAFENAVWHARGMNAIAAINIVMSAVLAILVIWRTILILVTIALIIATVVCALSLGTTCSVATAVARVEGYMIRNDPKVANNVMRVLGLLNATESAVATVIPFVAMGVAKENTEAAYSVDSAWTQSLSLLPSLNDKGWQTLNMCAKGWKSGKVVKRADPKTRAAKTYAAYEQYVNQSRMGFVVSLPVQADTYGLLCSEAAQFVGNQLAGALESMGVPGPAVQGIDAAMKVLGALVSSLPGVFCAPIGGAPPAFDDVIGNQAKDACNGEKDQNRVFVAGDETHVMYRDEDGKLIDEKKYMQKCMTKKKKEFKGKLTSSFSQGSGEWGVVSCGQPAKVWEWAVNGNVFMRSFSQVEKKSELAARDGKGIAIADIKKTTTVEPIDTEKVVAHAEMFFDCKNQWASGACRQSAMWALRWKARLRRVQPAGKLISSALEPIIVSTLTQALSELMNDKVTAWGKKALNTNHLPAVLFPSFKDTWLGRYIKTEIIMGGLYGSNAFEWVGNLVAKNSAKAGAIH